MRRRRDDGLASVAAGGVSSAFIVAGVRSSTRMVSEKLSTGRLAAISSWCRSARGIR